MGKTRTTFAFPDDDDGDPRKIAKKAREALTSAAMVLATKGQNSLLYNSQVIDYLTNSVADGNSQLAWYYYSRIPELRYTCRYVANALSVATLYVGLENPDGAPTRLPESHPASQLLANFAGGSTGQSDLLDRLGLHLTVVGDSVLIGPADGASLPAPFDQWRVYSTEEVSARSGDIYVQFPGNAREVRIPDGAIAIRIWRPHPRLWWDADSPVKGSFSVLRELDLLDQHVHASAVSRLAGAGLLGIPEELDLPNGDMEIEGTDVDKFVAMLTEVMGLAIKNRECAAALVPIILRGPAEYIDKIQHFNFSTPFAEAVPELRLGAIRRLSLGMDVPPEVLLGSSDSTSWSAWQTDESTLRVHLVPLLQLIASSLTHGWLRPALESIPMSDAQIEQIPKIVVGFDVSNLKIRQDTSGDAQALYDRDLIDANALRKSLGYSPDSEPTNDELALQILLKLVNSGQPDLTAYAIDALRDEYGITKLPKATSALTAGEAPVGAPPGPTPPVTAPIKGPLPGDRSQAKQTSPPPVPKIGDQSNNENK